MNYSSVSFLLAKINQEVILPCEKKWTRSVVLELELSVPNPQYSSKKPNALVILILIVLAGVEAKWSLGGSVER